MPCQSGNRVGDVCLGVAWSLYFRIVVCCIVGVCVGFRSLGVPLDVLMQLCLMVFGLARILVAVF